MHLLCISNHLVPLHSRKLVQPEAVIFIKSNKHYFFGIPAMMYKGFILTILLLNYTAGFLWNPLLARHPAWRRLGQLECGISAADRIIGGLNAALGQFPWLARLGYSAPDEPLLDWMCGGALLTPDRVITAAHCILTAGESYQLKKVRLGEYDSRTDPDCQLSVCAPKVQDRGIKRIISHPAFNNPPFRNDIAIIVLDAPVEINDYVSPICLPTSEQFSDLLPNELVTVAGWGKMNMTTDMRANILQYVLIPILVPERCNTFGKNFRMDASAICAGAQHYKDACGGDSGGPLMKVFDTDEGPKFYLVGVVSFGPTVCGITKPGVYTSVPFYLNWILDNL